jgi:Fe-S oxidoreductase
MYYPLDLQNIFKIFHASGVSWTLPKKWWEGTNYAMFTGDDKTWEETLRMQLSEVERLGCKKIAYTECGHGYYATLAGYKKFGIEPGVEVVHVVSLYAQWIREGRFNLDPSRNPEPVTIHDPCNATRKASMDGFASIVDDLRFVLHRVCQQVIEPTPNREANYCCGGGGGALLAGYKSARVHYGKPKVDQIDRTGAPLVCTPCVNCYDAITGLATEFKRIWKPVHLWKLLARAIVL